MTADFSDSTLNRTPDQDSQQNPPGRDNYFSRHWRGHNSLAWAWWVNFVLINVLMTILARYLVIAGISNFYLGFGFTLFAILLYVWQVVGVWRSGKNYVLNAQNSAVKGSGAWGRVAQVFLSFGIVIVSLNNFPILADYIAIFRAEDDFSNYYLQQPVETDLVLNGYISHQSVAEIIRRFESDPALSALVLNSPGGVIDAAYLLADYVIEQDIAVVGRIECISACVYLLAAANMALVTPDTNIVFHHPEPIVELRSRDAQMSMDEFIDDYYYRLEAFGMPADKLAEYRSNELTPISIGEAFDYSIIDYVFDPSTGEYYDSTDLCSLVDCYASPILLNTPLSVYGDRINILELATGICFDDSSMGSGSLTFAVSSIPCEEPHDNEVYATESFELPDYPGQDEIETLAHEICLESFEGFVGTDYENSSLDIFTFSPSAQSWRDGDRRINCVLYDMNLEKLRGSVEGSGV